MTPTEPNVEAPEVRCAPPQQLSEVCDCALVFSITPSSYLWIRRLMGYGPYKPNATNLVCACMGRLIE